jgi:hypothetical protein
MRLIMETAWGCLAVLRNGGHRNAPTISLAPTILPVMGAALRSLLIGGRRRIGRKQRSRQMSAFGSVSAMCTYRGVGRGLSYPAAARRAPPCGRGSTPPPRKEGKRPFQSEPAVDKRYETGKGLRPEDRTNWRSLRKGRPYQCLREGHWVDFDFPMAYFSIL